MKRIQQTALSALRETLSPLSNPKPKPAIAEVLRLLLRAVESGRELDPWLSFPQTGCCFSFGPEGKPLPIGALHLLWSEGSPFVQECPDCGDKIYMIYFGGLLSMGGGSLVRVGCGQSWFQFMGGLGRVGRIIKETSIGESCFHLKGGRFGGAFGSDGAELCKLLGAKIPGSEQVVSLRLDDGSELSIDLDCSN